MGALTKFKLTGSGIKALLRSDSVRHGLEERMSRALAEARASAPYVTGSYRDSLHLETDIHDRVVVRIVADVPYAVAVEAEHGTLNRALDHARE